MFDGAEIKETKVAQWDLSAGSGDACWVERRQWTQRHQLGREIPRKAPLGYGHASAGGAQWSLADLF